MLYEYGKHTHDFFWSIFIVFLSLECSLLGGVFDKTIIPLALVGYEMIIANSALCASLAIYHLISNARLWNNC